jgi:hypothetical protein
MGDCPRFFQAAFENFGKLFGSLTWEMPHEEDMVLV